MKEFLNLISPADKILQSRDVGYREALPIIKTVISEVEKQRTAESFDKIWKRSDEILVNHGVEFSSLTRSSRNKKIPSVFNTFIITDRICERSKDVSIGIKSTHYEVIDIFTAEMERRFGENSDILLAISDANEFSIEKLQPLKRLGLALPTDAELTVAKSYTDKKRQ